RRVRSLVDRAARLPAAGDATGREAKGPTLSNRRRGAAMGQRPATPLRRILEQAAPFHPVTLEQFADAVVERTPGFETDAAKLGTRHHVIALVGILTDRGEVNVEVRHVPLHAEGQFLLGNIGGIETEIV